MWRSESGAARSIPRKTSRGGDFHADTAGTSSDAMQVKQEVKAYRGRSLVTRHGTICRPLSPFSPISTAEEAAGIAKLKSLTGSSSLLLGPHDLDLRHPRPTSRKSLTPPSPFVVLIRDDCSAHKRDKAADLRSGTGLDVGANLSLRKTRSTLSGEPASARRGAACAAGAAGLEGPRALQSRGGLRAAASRGSFAEHS
jgi:hypothetical protein